MHTIWTLYAHYMYTICTQNFPDWIVYQSVTHIAIIVFVLWWVLLDIDRVLPIRPVLSF